MLVYFKDNNKSICFLKTITEYHKDLCLSFQCYNHKLISINKFGDGIYLYSCIILLNKLFLYNPYVYIRENEKKIPKITSILISANQKVNLKNWTLFSNEIKDLLALFHWLLKLGYWFSTISFYMTRFRCINIAF